MRLRWLYFAFSFPALLTVLFHLPLKATTVSTTQLDSWREQIRSTLFISNPLPALSPQSYGKFSLAPGVIAERVTYGTEYGMRIPAVLYLPEHPTGKIPALLVVNGHGGDKYSWYSFYTGILYAREGGAVLTYDPIGEGERNAQRKSGTGEHDRVVDAPSYPQHLSGLMITDVMQGVSYLSQRPEIDAKRIGILGYSMGSFVSALTGAVDTRIRIVVLSGGGDLDGPDGYWDKSTKTMCQSIPWKSLSVLGDRPAVVFALNEMRGPTYIINGSEDTVVDIPHHLEPFFEELRHRVVAITGTSTNILETYFVPDVNHRPNWVTRPAALWIQSKLNFPDWTPKQIEALPVTHISEWAQKNNVDIGKSYMQEEREGGVMALRDDVPNVPHRNLNVLSDEQWEKQKDSFIYESFVQHALVEISKESSGSADSNPIKQ
jgi:dienelactone hydrolase